MIESNFRHSSTINSKTDSLEISLLLVFPPQQVETDRQQSLDDWIERKLILTLVSKPNHQFIKRGNKSFNSNIKNIKTKNASVTIKNRYLITKTIYD